MTTDARRPLSALAGGLAVLAFALIVLAGSAGTTLGLRVSGSSIETLDGSLAPWRIVVSALAGLLALALVAATRLYQPASGRAAAAAIVALVLMLVEIVSLGAPGRGASAGFAAGVHLGATALLFAVAVALCLQLAPSEISQRMAAATPRSRSRAFARFKTLTNTTLGALFVVLVSGAWLSAGEQPTACRDWPLCGSESTLSTFLRPDMQMLHREFVLLAGILLAAIVIESVRNARTLRGAAPALAMIATVFAAEIAIGAIAVNGASSGIVSAAHYAVAGVVWLLLVVLALAVNAPVTVAHGAHQSVAAATPAWRETARDYFRVTKPGIMLLLLTTTFFAMLAAAQGWPSLGLVIATLSGGALAAGGASALNCYFDRDIDVVMARTRKRAIPTGRLTPAQVRRFGLTLSALAVVVLALFVNPFAALLALGGNLFYVVVYTRFLKRRTPQNIVIGGAAGAFPPLVGWAAVTGSLSLTPILLFALVYYWTPPHFWSLALLKARDYERASIPMLPVTHGAEQTRKFILLYALQLVAITLLIAPAAGTGWGYLGAALVLGAVFVMYATRMYLEGSSRLAWRLFKYSNYYLALILLALVLDITF